MQDTDLAGVCPLISVALQKKQPVHRSQADLIYIGPMFCTYPCGKGFLAVGRRTHLGSVEGENHAKKILGERK